MLEFLPLYQQAILTLAALVLFTSFVLLSKNRVVPMINVFAWQGLLVAVTTALVAYDSGDNDLYISAILAVVLKAMFIPWLLHRLVTNLGMKRDNQSVRNPTLVMMIATVLVVFCYYVVQPIEELSSSITRNTIAVSMSVVLLGMLMLVTRNKAVAQVVGFMSIENGLFFAAVASTHGMPMIVELGVAFDVLVAAVIFGVFFFQIRDSIDSLDVDLLNHLSENGE